MLSLQSLELTGIRNIKRNFCILSGASNFSLKKIFLFCSTAPYSPSSFPTAHSKYSCETAEQSSNSPWQISLPNLHHFIINKWLISIHRVSPLFKQLMDSIIASAFRHIQQGASIIFMQ